MYGVEGLCVEQQYDAQSDYENASGCKQKPLHIRRRKGIPVFASRSLSKYIRNGYYAPSQDLGGHGCGNGIYYIMRTEQQLEQIRSEGSHKVADNVSYDDDGSREFNAEILSVAYK